MENNNFEYKVSVIVPLYNVENYLRKCLDSLLLQTIDISEMEILLIDDGSTDNSACICKEYVGYSANFKYIYQDNSGPATARNTGISMAKGKYIMFLDADDEFSESVVENVSNFFDQHYDEIDVVTFPERIYRIDGVARTPHIRYKTLNKTDIYDLEEYFYILQARITIATKNLFNENIFFDEDLGYHEDLKYCNELIRSKLKIGFVDNIEYHYNERNGSIVNEEKNAITLFEPTTKYWEDLFNSYEDDVPAYFQALFVHDLGWKLSQNCLFPYHYQAEDFFNAESRLWRLLDQVSEEVILKHPSVDNFHKYYFLEKKKNNIVPFTWKNGFYLISNGKILLEKESFELIFNKLKVRNGKLTCFITLKSQFFNFHESPFVYVVENGLTKKRLDIFQAASSYYKSKTLTNNFWSFYYECDMKCIDSFCFEVYVDGLFLPTHYYHMPTSPFLLQESIIRDEYIIHFKNNAFYIDKANEEQAKNILASNNRNIKKVNNNAYRLRVVSEKWAVKRVWLYYDCRGIQYDNGYLQFMHDFSINDGVERYYVFNNDPSIYANLFSENQKKNIIQFGSELHKQLFIRAEKIITAYIEEVNLYPFPATDKRLYMDLMNAEIVYLQHGVLHAELLWKYSPEKIEVDKVVVSSYFEQKNFNEKYGFRKQDILPFGMPRLEKLDRDQAPSNRILYAPSWRMYLIGECRNTIWELTDDKFVNSKYFIETQKLLNHPLLHKILQDNDLYLDFKIHPIFEPYLKHYAFNSERITIGGNMVKDEEYALFITDFSSYVFNFVYLKRPIIYFVPDMNEFLAGLNQYRRLDLPFDEGFGELSLEADKTVNIISSIVEQNFKIDRKYRERMETFFLPISSCTKKIYEWLINN